MIKDKITIFSVNLENNNFLNDDKTQFCLKSWSYLKDIIINQGYDCEIKIFNYNDDEVLKYKTECQHYVTHTKSLSRVADGFRMYILSKYKNHLWLDLDVWINSNIKFINKPIFTNDWWYIYNKDDLKTFKFLYDSFYLNSENIFNNHPEWIKDWSDSDIFKNYIHVGINQNIIERLKSNFNLVHLAPLFNRLSDKFSFKLIEYKNINELEIHRTKQIEKHSVLHQSLRFPKNNELTNLIKNEISKIGNNLTMESINQIDTSNLDYYAENKYMLDSIEVEITDKCNLNCVGCDHLSCLTTKEEIYDIDLFERDIIQINKLFFLRRLLIMGGEPTLCDKLEDYIKIAFKHLAYTQIELWTNGTKPDILKKLEQEFPTLKIRCAGYGVVVDYKTNKVGRNHTEGESLKPWWKIDINLKGDSDPYLARVSCMEAKSFILHKGMLYNCPILKNIHKLNDTFNLNINLNDEERGINIYEHSSQEIILDLFNCQANRCRYCSEKRTFRNWTYGKMESPSVSDYVDISTLD